MRISQKCYYALKSVLELARRQHEGVISIGLIGQAQSIPPQFLQVIMRELRQGGFVESRRGKEGGYLLTRSPAEITVGSVIRFLEGDFSPVDCPLVQSGSEDSRCHRNDPCLFAPIWGAVKQAVDEIVDGITFQDLLQRDQRERAARVVDFVI